MPTFSLPRPQAQPCAARPAARLVAARASQIAPAVAIPVKTPDGGDKSSMDLALKVADPRTAKGVVHRYLITVRQNMRAGTASTLTRGEVRGGGKKPYRQKGTGQARRGSTRSPLFPGGGVVFGPKPKDWSIEMNKKERRLAMATALQSAAEDMTAIESFAPVASDPRTRVLVDTCRGVGADPMAEHVLVITHGANAEVQRAGKNIKRLKVNQGDALKVYDVLRADKIVVETAALEDISRRYTKLSHDRSPKHNLRKGWARGSYQDLLAIKAGYTGGKKKPELRRGGGGGGGGSDESAPAAGESEPKGDAAE